MLEEEDPDSAAPQEPFDPVGEPSERVADRERDAQREQDPEQVHPVDRADEPVLVQVLAVQAALLHPEAREHPADVRVDEPLEGRDRAVAVAGVRRMRIAVLIRERVVLAVICDPLGERPLHRHAAQDRERRLHRRARLEGAVREVAVEPDRDAEGADHVHPGHDREVARVEGDAPEGARGEHDPERRHDDRDERHDLADPARARPDSTERYGQPSGSGAGESTTSNHLRTYTNHGSRVPACFLQSCKGEHALSATSS